MVDIFNIFTSLQRHAMKAEQNRQVIHLHIIETDAHHYFGSIAAMYEHFTATELGVALQSLYNKWDGDTYQNGRIVIRRGRLVQKKHQAVK